MMRIVYSSLILVTALAWGIWCGGDLTKLFGISLVGLIGALSILVISTLIMKTKLGRVSLPIGVLTALFAGVLIGSAYSSSAFNECIIHGERVREELARFKEQNGHYPYDLSELEMDLPGKRLLRSNILDYRRTENGYNIQFQDWLITHIADETFEFQARK